MEIDFVDVPSYALRGVVHSGLNEHERFWRTTERDPVGAWSYLARATWTRMIASPPVRRENRTKIESEEFLYSSRFSW
jgi:hypothetical protein